MKVKTLCKKPGMGYNSEPSKWVLFALFALCSLLSALCCFLCPTGAVAQQGEALSAVIENNVITGNTAASGGGIASYSGSPIIRNNLLIQNASTGEDGGGAIYIFGTSSLAKLTGNTISANTAATTQGGGIHVKEGDATIFNSILWQNQGDLFNCSATYSDVTDIVANPGAGNISSDPLFVQTIDPDATGYYRLSDTSPCVDAGDPAYRPEADEKDIKGSPRFAGVRIDIGADEMVDTQGPAISNAKFNGTNLTNGMVLQQSGTFTASAADPAAVSRLEFSIDTTVICTDTDGSNGYSCSWNIYLTEDGSHTLTITAYDSLGNSRSVSFTVNVAMIPPPSPTITFPVSGSVLRTVNITATGMADKNTTVLLYNNDVQAGSQVSVDTNGNFRFPMALTEGINRLQATATNRAGTSPRSVEVVVTLDTSVPKAPVNLSALSKAGGIIGLTWTSPAGTLVKGYNLYRSTAAFTSTSEATKVNTSLITRTSYDDLPSVNGTYYYGATTVDQTSIESPLSNIVSAISDRTVPRAVSIEYMPTGNYDQATMRIAQGLVDIRLVVSEPLQTTPFLSMTPNGGVPIPVDLTKTSDLEYSGSFMISESDPSGPAYAVFSARDMVGNRGTAVDSGASFIIDTQGPAISSIEIQPGQPIKNEQTSPVLMTLTIGLNEQVKPGQAPELSYLLSGPGRTPVPIGAPTQIATRPGHSQTWQVTFSLLADAGLAQVENLQFVYRGTDDLENVSARILCDNSFQVYQGNLPPLDPPQNLIGKSLRAGRIKLTWAGVTGAAGYQLYRQPPGETQLTAYQVLGIVLEFTEIPSPDGIYKYAVASIRHENSQEAVSAISNIVEVASDSIPPGPPQNLALELSGSGIKATWQAPPDTEPFTYSLYRSNLPEITSVEGMIPILSRISAATAIDSHPSHTDHSYVVTAVDSAGNQSMPSNSFYLNFDLLPVSSLKVVQTEAQSPVISWTHPGGDIAGYNIYLVTGGQSEKLNQVLVTGLSYTDLGFTGDDRNYTVTAVDQNTIESIGRSITLPKLFATLKEGEQIRRGIINRLEYIVDNRSTSKVEHIKLKGLIGTHQHLSDEFSVDPAGSQTVSVPVGGYADLTDLVTFTTNVEITPQEGDLVQIVRSKQVEVIDDKLVLQILNDPFTRGGFGRAWFTLENTGEEEIEVVMATGSGASASNEITFYLLDRDGNVLTSKAYKQNTGENVVTLADGSTVARIPAGSIFTSNPIDITVPLTSPDQVSIHAEIAKIHFHHGQPDYIWISGLDATNDISLKDTAYYGEIISISPESSPGDEDIIITGRAIDRSTGAPMPSAALNLVITVSGFERTNKIFTDDTGNFTFAFKPLAGESGIYKVRAVHPEVLDKPVQGQFVISKLSINPMAINLNLPKNYEQTANIRVTTGDGTIAHNLRLAYEEHDQPSGVFPEGVHITLGNTIALLGSKQTGTLSFKIWGDNSAAATGRIVLQVKSDETVGDDSRGIIVIDMQFSEAKPSLYFTPNHVETGVAYDQIAAETITLQNKGLADLNDVSVSVISQTGEAAPGWVHLNSASDQGVIAVGAQRQINISFSPTPAVTEGIYSFYLRVTSSNYQTTDIGIYVSVTQSGIGNAIFKVSDIYTGTLDQNNQLIEGLSGAKITVQNEQVLTIEQNKYTDTLGEALFTGLPTGTYKYRVSAANHQEQIGRLWIKAGLAASEQVFLTYNLVTVEWEVRETTIQDKYEIVLQATYVTNVPAPVVVIEPKSVTLPDMKAGGVFYGEFTITNYGLIRADNMKLTLPPSDQYFKYEILKGVPESLEAKGRITVPYRVTALQSINQPEGGGGGEGGCSYYSVCLMLEYAFKCVNGVWTRSADQFCYTYSKGTCGGSGGGGVGVGGVIIPIYIGGPGSGGGGGGSVTLSGGGPTSQPISGPICAPKRKCPVGDESKGDACCEIGNDSTEPGYSKIDLLRGEYTDDVTDLSVKALGHRINVKRLYYDDRWHFDNDRKKIEIIYGNSGAIESIDKDGVSYEKTDTSGKVFSLQTDSHIYVKDDGYLWEDKSGNWARFDLSGRMISYGNPNNVKVSIIYESGENGRLIGMADNSGTQVLWYEYNTNGTLSVVRDGSGRKVQYFYDSSGRLSKLVDLLGNESFYYYDSEGKITSKKDAAGRTYNVAYNSYGFVKSITNQQGTGKFFDYGYDSGTQERYSMVRYSSGKIVERWYDRFANKIRTDINGRTIPKVLKDGRTKIFTDAAGNKTYKEYDEKHNLIKQTNPDGTTLTYTYDPRFNKVLQEVNERGIITKYEYDSSGNMTKKMEAFETANGRVTEYTYDVTGSPLSAKIVGDARTQEAVSTMTYDSFGNLKSRTGPEGNSEQFTYDVMGNVLTRTDARNKVWTYIYDGVGRLTSQTDPLNNTASYEYDGVGNKTKETDPEGKVKTYEYDSDNRMISARDALSNLTQFAYNPDGNLIKQIDPEGKEVNFEYDLDGRLVKTIDGNGNETTTEYNDIAGSSCSSCSGSGASEQPSKTIFPTYTKEYKYDNRGRRIGEKDVLSATEAYPMQFTYDAVGSVLSQTDKENRATTYQYDELNRRVKITDPSAGVTEYTYDGRNNLISLKDPKGNTTAFEYDRNNRLTKESRPLGQATTYQYDAAGKLIRKADAKNQKTEYEYDDAGRLTKTKYFASATDTTPVKAVEFTYDKAGNLTGYNDGATSATYTYDGAYRKLNETVNYGTFELAYSYSYFKNGLKKSLTMPDGTTYDYSYDNNSQVSVISVPGQGFITYNSYTWNMPSTITLPGGTKKENTYTPLMQLKSLAVKDPAQNALMGYNYDYSPAGNVTGKNTEHGNYTYQYDELYRLIAAINPGSNESYTYDPVGNRLTSADVQGNWAYNENNELLSYNGVSYEYDANGNTIGKTDQTGTTTYTYDIDNRLVSINNAQSSIVNYYYDPFGKRLWKEIGGVRTNFFYSDEGLIGEYDLSGTETRTYGYAPNSTWTTDPLFQKTGSNYYWYQNDHLGTVQNMIDTSGVVVWAATYDVFGRANVTVATIENSLRFPGQKYDPETGLQYNWNRFYDPKIGRYLTPDPIGLEGGINFFLYAGSNPTNFIDPLGLWKKSGHRELTAKAAAMVSCFTEEELREIETANISVDQLTNHVFDYLHFMPGTRNMAELSIDANFEHALELQKCCRQKEALKALGEGLHTLQDRYSHYEQNAGWTDHAVKDPDNPEKHPVEYQKALAASVRYLAEFCRRKEACKK